MKKLFAIATICLLTTVAANAQMGQGREQMMAAQKQKLVDSLGVTPAIADSVMAVRMSYMMKQRDLRGDGQTPPTDDQKAQMKKMRDEMRTRLKAFLTEDQITNTKPCKCVAVAEWAVVVAVEIPLPHLQCSNNKLLLVYKTL